MTNQHKRDDGWKQDDFNRWEYWAMGCSVLAGVVSAVTYVAIKVIGWFIK